jgi:hypothetical protein
VTPGLNPTVKLTGPCAAAMKAVLAADRAGRRAWRANHTALDAQPLLVHHRTVDWFEAHGLVLLEGDMVIVTPAGRVATGTLTVREAT